MKRDIISVADMKEDFTSIIELAMKLKRGRYDSYDDTKNRVLALIFEKPSTRTRISFEVAMRQLGGHSIYLNPNDMQMGRGETISDTAKVLSRFVDVIAYRAFENANVRELALNASVPVINALDNKEHPVQMLADFMTILERKGRLKGLKLVYVGDGNNVANSLMIAGAITGVNVTIASPKGFEPKDEFVSKAKSLSSSARIEVTNDASTAVADADVIYTDVWISMGEEKEKERKEKAFSGFQVNSALMRKADPAAMFLHCLPAHRGLEVSADVIDGGQSFVFDEAENRLHTEKALLLKLLKF
ncbi:MAG: ornithine carbamoyltransferase [Candidatus Thermoplasmatota archaeon]|jgi:ornithine carbamoyltransferase|nr:ornithine carbamoyltransferase [Candidatus Thermoplasmatota archaeon]MCL5794680.1 ornithine carbamoyltransferase [Candidatus Thermoplasmatota archaeon]